MAVRRTSGSTLVVRRMLTSCRQVSRAARDGVGTAAHDPDPHGCEHLWVPKTPSASCGERVFVDDAADPVAAVDADSVEVGNRCWEGLEGCCLIEGAVRLVGVVVGLILTKGLAVGAAGSRSTSGRGVRVGSCRSSVP